MPCSSIIPTISPIAPTCELTLSDTKQEQRKSLLVSLSPQFYIAFYPLLKLSMYHVSYILHMPFLSLIGSACFKQPPEDFKKPLYSVLIIKKYHAVIMRFCIVTFFIKTIVILFTERIPQAQEFHQMIYIYKFFTL